MFCGKCGAEVPDGYEFCMNCGTKVEQTQEANTDIVKKKTKKWLVPIIVVTVLAIIAILAIFFINNSKKSIGLYKNIAWETSFENVTSFSEKEKGIENFVSSKEKAFVSYTVENYDNDEDVSATVFLDCKNNNTLYRVVLFITNGDESKLTDTQLYDKYESEFTKLYGDSEVDILGEKWTTEKSEIVLVYLADNMFTLEYRDINAIED